MHFEILWDIRHIEPKARWQLADSTERFSGGPSMNGAVANPVQPPTVWFVMCIVSVLCAGCWQ